MAWIWQKFIFLSLQPLQRSWHRAKFRLNFLFHMSACSITDTGPTRLQVIYPRRLTSEPNSSGHVRNCSCHQTFPAFLVLHQGSDDRLNTTVKPHYTHHKNTPLNIDRRSLTQPTNQPALLFISIFIFEIFVSSPVSFCSFLLVNVSFFTRCRTLPPPLTPEDISSHQLNVYFFFSLGDEIQIWSYKSLLVGTMMKK